ncbi:frataxin homolog, mitochondrial [Bactrocera neohumeralis]|uniref:frataxin homolog, mitochondrial n=1 Tax=Bactrocera tryoni TaxID=59916 RepID=UPI001A98E89A|nr:frataxin homolog, mitochondrial [Bactrocera tryoni]XP_050332435.1 frataxin homolog, mitochondrial [Bactrocera neohumeralis]
MSSLLVLRALRICINKNHGRNIYRLNFGRQLPHLHRPINSTSSYPQVLSTHRSFGSTTESKNDTNATLVDSNTYERVCSETLDALCDYFEELTENAQNLSSCDVTYGDGVLTVKFGNEYGTYVINRQTPNKQIWLSSPTSGPKRYDFVSTEGQWGRWIYKHSGECLHDLLQRELRKILTEQDFDFSQLPYGK